MIPHVTLRNVPVVACEGSGYHLQVGGRVVILPAADLLCANVPGKWEYDWSEGPPPVAGRTYDIEVRTGWATKTGLDPNSVDVLATFLAEGGRKSPPTSPYAANTRLAIGMRSIVLHFDGSVVLGVPVRAILSFSVWGGLPEGVTPGTVIPITEGPNMVGEAVVQQRVT